MIDTLTLSAIEQFYYREARLLDERQYKQWLNLCDESIEYIIPNRSMPHTDRKDEGSESFHAISRELEGAAAHESPLRVDSYFSLAIRADRMLKQSAWAENPPARTRRLITNIELLTTEQGSDNNQSICHTCSNFLLYYSRHQQDNFIYVGQRRDTLYTHNTDKPNNKGQDNSPKEPITIAKREVILDWNVIVAPTVALLF